MTPRLKKLIGLFILLPGLLAYVLGAIVLADRVPAHWLAQLLYFAVAGVAWAFPFKFLMAWMNAEPSRSGTDG